MTTHPDTAPSPPVGVWLGASYALERPIAAGKPYPHLCGVTVTGQATGRQMVLTGRECAACAQRRALRHGEAHEIPAPRFDTAALAAGDTTDD